MFSHATKEHTKLLTADTNWTSSPNTFSADELIDAWEKGRQDGFLKGQGAVRRAMESLLQTNLDTAFQLSENIVSTINETGLKCRRAFLRIDNVDLFSALFLIDEDDIASDKVNEAYEVAGRMEAEANTPEFGYEFMFVPFGADTNITKIEADGYNYSYRGTN